MIYCVFRFLSLKIISQKFDFELWDFETFGKCTISVTYIVSPNG